MDTNITAPTEQAPFAAGTTYDVTGRSVLLFDLQGRADDAGDAEEPAR
jgi:hypothetical protein